MCSLFDKTAIPYQNTTGFSVVNGFRKGLSSMLSGFIKFLNNFRINR